MKRPMTEQERDLERGIKRCDKILGTHRLCAERDAIRQAEIAELAEAIRAAQAAALPQRPDRKRTAGPVRHHHVGDGAAVMPDLSAAGEG
jgi:hypothetical protein